MDEESKHLKRIEQFIIDDGQIATYKWVSRTMGIPVNQAKQLLLKFLHTLGKSYEDTLSATYLVSGKHVDGAQSMVIAKDSELAKIKSSFIDVISEHVYSIQNSKSIADYEMLYAVDTFEVTSTWKASPIKCSLCVPRDDIVYFEQPKVSSTASKDGKKEITKPVTIKKEPAKEAAKEAKLPVADNTLVAKDLNKREDKKPITVDKKSKDDKVESSSAEKQQKTNSISSMFSAQQKKSQASVKKLGKEDSKDDSVKKEPDTPKHKKEKTKKKPQKKPAPKADEEEKKRKRIRVLSDSDDSDQEDVDRSPSPAPEPDPEPVVEVDMVDDMDNSPDSGHKRKKRKMVEKQEIDDQGYLHTTQEYVMETDSEPECVAEIPVIAKKTPPQAEKPKQSTANKSSSPKKKKGKVSNDGKKQPTLFSFFKKS